MGSTEAVQNITSREARASGAGRRVKENPLDNFRRPDIQPPTTETHPNRMPQMVKQSVKVKAPGPLVIDYLPFFYKML